MREIRIMPNISRPNTAVRNTVSGIAILIIRVLAKRSSVALKTTVLITLP
jgi:hypothetical protein